MSNTHLSDAPELPALPELPPPALPGLELEVILGGGIYTSAQMQQFATEYGRLCLAQARAEAKLAEGAPWQTIAEAHPPRHQRALVERNGLLFTATPCYGMHAPWWVVKTMSGEAEPVDMRDGDRWCSEFTPAAPQGPLLSEAQIAEVMGMVRVIRFSHQHQYEGAYSALLSHLRSIKKEGA